MAVTATVLSDFGGYGSQVNSETLRRASVLAYDLPPFTTYSGAIGLGKGSWRLEAYGENLTDTRAQLYANFRQYYKEVTVNRPRTVGLRLTYKPRG